MHVVITATAIVGVWAAGAPAADAVPETPPLAFALSAGAIGVALVGFGLGRLPRDPARLARLWDLPPPSAVP
jgi:hypothetical protein